MIESHQARFGIAAQPAPARHRQQLDLERLGTSEGEQANPSSTEPMTASKPAREADSEVVRHTAWA